MASVREALASGITPVLRNAELAEAIRASHAAGIGALEQSIAEATSGWRKALLEAAEVRLAVPPISSAIAEALAARQTYLSDSMAALRQASIQTILPLTGTAGVLAELQRSLQGPFQQIAEQAQLTNRLIYDALRPAAQAASYQWGLQARLRDELQRGYAEELQDSGWMLAPSWPMHLGYELVQIRWTKGKRALDRAVCSMYSENGHKLLRGTVESWMDVPAFRARRALLREGVKLHREGRWRPSIALVLPHVEGIAVEVFHPGAERVKHLELYRTGVDPDRLDGLIAEGLLAILDVLYGWVSFRSVKLRSRELRRHPILHGRTIAFGSEPNSLRVFLALDLLAAEARAKAEYDARSAPAA